MLRITAKAEQPGHTVLAVHGRIAGHQVRILADELEARADHADRVILDLDGVAHVDVAGQRLLQQWCGRGLQLCGGSTFVRALLALDSG